MDYENKYKEALKRAEGVIEQNPLMEYLKKGIEYIFPELKENREERIAKEILNIVVSVPDNKWHGYSIGKEEAIEWLKKNYPRATFKSTTVGTSDITTITTKTNENEL